MNITVKAKPSSRETSVTELPDGTYEVAVTEPPVQGRANAAIISALANHFDVSRSAVSIVTGWTSRNKIISIAK